MLVAVNDTPDNGTIAAIVGAAMSAAHVTVWMPVAWRSQLLGRTREENDGYVFTLIDRAAARFAM